VRDDDVEQDGPVQVHGDVGARLLAVVPGRVARDADLVRVVVGDDGLGDAGDAVGAVSGPRNGGERFDELIAQRRVALRAPAREAALAGLQAV
jgi:hypothetical protein